MKTHKMLSMILETKLWNDKLEEEDIKLLEDVRVMSDNLISQVYIFIDLFHQYIDLVQSAAIFSPEFVEPEENDAKVYPTQTLDSAASMNREVRRAEKKKKTPLDIVRDKK